MSIVPGAPIEPGDGRRWNGTFRWRPTPVRPLRDRVASVHSIAEVLRAAATADHQRAEQLLVRVRHRSTVELATRVQGVVGRTSEAETWAEGSCRVLLPPSMVDHLGFVALPSNLAELDGSSAARRVRLSLRVAPSRRQLRLKLRTYDGAGRLLGDEFLHLPPGLLSTTTFVDPAAVGAVVAPVDASGHAAWWVLPPAEFRTDGEDGVGIRDWPGDRAVPVFEALLAWSIVLLDRPEIVDRAEIATTLLDRYLEDLAL